MLATLLLGITMSSARAASFTEFLSWCAPEDRGGRPALCSAYLETYLENLASADPNLNDGVRACVPASADRTELVRQVLAYAAEHPAKPDLSGIGGVGMALQGHYPCP
jgi:hypothetical protein